MDLVILGMVVMLVCGMALLGGIYIASVTDRAEVDEAAAASAPGPHPIEVALVGQRVDRRAGAAASHR